MGLERYQARALSRVPANACTSRAQPRALLLKQPSCIHSLQRASAALLVCAQEIRADNRAVFFRHEYLMFGGAPVREGSILIRVAGQRIGFTSAEDRLHNRPDRIVIPRRGKSNQHSRILSQLHVPTGSSCTLPADGILKLSVSSMFLVLLLKPAATTVGRNSVVLRRELGTSRENHCAAGEDIL